MNELEIQRHSFDVAKNRLKEFSEKKEVELDIDRVKTDGVFFGLGEHHVTGQELNSRLKAIQNHFIDLNKTSNKTIKEFREVYNALDILDKDYITSIVANVKAIEKTSNDVREQQKTLKQHNDKLAIQHSKLDNQQIEINKNVENMKKIVTTLKNFKEKLDEFKHLNDIDQVWADLNNAKTNIMELFKLIEDCNKQLQIYQIAVDSLKEGDKNQDEKIKGISKELAEVNAFSQDNRILIEELQSFRNSIDVIEHVSDIDSMWSQVNMLKDNLEYTNSDILSLKDKISEIEKNITGKSNETLEKIAVLEKKLKYAYYIAGGALGLAVIELILVFTGGI